MRTALATAALMLMLGCTHPGTAPRYIYTADYMADPSVHLFDGTIYIYPTHDRVSEVTSRENGNHYDMADYHVLKMNDIAQPEAEDCGTVLSVADVPWAAKQMWANDAAAKNGKYYLYFSAKDADGIFRIGAAVADSPEGPFTPQAEPMAGVYSIDPAVFGDGDDFYIIFGGISGGQLQRWRDNRLTDCDALPANGEAAIAPRIARLSDDMLSIVGESQPLEILDGQGRPLTADDPHRFFEAAWMHKHDGRYYFSWSTGSHHTICYATGDNPCGPFTLRGVLLTPVTGWTTHHSTVEIGGRWYLFHHDSGLSGGKSSLRSLKVAPITHNADGTITTVDGGERRFEN